MKKTSGTAAERITISAQEYDIQNYNVKKIMMLMMPIEGWKRMPLMSEEPEKMRDEEIAYGRQLNWRRVKK